MRGNQALVFALINKNNNSTLSNNNKIKSSANITKSISAVEIIENTNVLLDVIEDNEDIVEDIEDIIEDNDIEFDVINAQPTQFLNMENLTPTKLDHHQSKPLSQLSPNSDNKRAVNVDKTITKGIILAETSAILDNPFDISSNDVTPFDNNNILENIEDIEVEQIDEVSTNIDGEGKKDKENEKDIVIKQLQENEIDLIKIENNVESKESIKNNKNEGDIMCAIDIAFAVSKGVEEGVKRAVELINTTTISTPTPVTTQSNPVCNNNPATNNNPVNNAPVSNNNPVVSTITDIPKIESNILINDDSNIINNNNGENNEVNRNNLKPIYKKTHNNLLHIDGYGKGLNKNKNWEESINKEIKNSKKSLKYIKKQDEYDDDDDYIDIEIQNDNHPFNHRSTMYNDSEERWFNGKCLSVYLFRYHFLIISLFIYLYLITLSI
jgi:hypothetical protein